MSWAITGLGALTAAGPGRAALHRVLHEGRSCLERREAGVGAWVDDAGVPAMLGGWHEAASHWLRRAPRVVRLALAAAAEALGPRVPEGRCAVIVAGNNLLQSHVYDSHERHRDRMGYTSPRYALEFVDTSLVAAISEVFGLRGPGLTVGATAASGNAALHLGSMMLATAQADAVLCVGSMVELSPLESHALANMGARDPGSPDRPATQTCRPFDAAGKGFVPGEGAAAILLERGAQAAARGAAIHGWLRGSSLGLHGRAEPTPDAAAEQEAMRDALHAAGMAAADIALVAAHGTGTPAGDRAEAQAIAAVLGLAPWVNASKELVGHTFFASGLVQAVATLIQLHAGFAHANPNLLAPIDPAPRLTGPRLRVLEGRSGLSNAFSYGGFHSSVVLSLDPGAPS